VSIAQAQTLDISASDGYINEVIEADTLANGSQAHSVYNLVTLDDTYEFSGALSIKEDLTIMGTLDPGDQRPPCIQPTVLPNGDIPPILFLVNQPGINVEIKNLYLLAAATNNSYETIVGTAISITADDVRLSIDNCVFDAWHGFGIGYSGQWDSFFITNSHFRNFVHPSQWYVGEVIRNTWPGEAYTDTLSMVGNTMLCLNGYAAAPVTKFYQKYFEFVDNRVLYTFKNPFFIFNTTEGKINDNIFYANYSGGVDTTEHPWWDNLWYPDSSYGVIALQPLNEHNAKMFVPGDSSNPNIMAIAESLRTVQVMNNTYYWPTDVTNFWTTWNNTQPNTIRTPVFMNDRTVDMFADDAAYPGLVASNNMEVATAYMTNMDNEIQNGTPDRYNIGFFDYFEQVRTGIALSDYWGYQLIDVGPSPNWTPPWPLPESAYIVGIEDEMKLNRPSSFVLHGAYPNPFNPGTNVKFTLNEPGNIDLVVFNVLGERVKTLVKNEFRKANTYNIPIDMSEFSSGIYFTVLKQGTKTATKKMMLLK
jgi:hypothetical protein